MIYFCSKDKKKKAPTKNRVTVRSIKEKEYKLEVYHKGLKSTIVKQAREIKTLKNRLVKAETETNVLKGVLKKYESDSGGRAEFYPRPSDDPRRAGSIEPKPGASRRAGK